MSRLVVHLLSTCPVDRPSSMFRFSGQVERILLRYAPELDVRRHDLAPESKHLSSWPAWLRPRMHHPCVNHKARRLAGTSPAGLFHVLDGSHAYLADHFPGERVVVTCHDLIPLHMVLGHFGSRPGLPARLLIRRSAAALTSVASILAVSARTSRDIQEQTGAEAGRVSVAHPPVSEPWTSRLAQPRAPRLGAGAYIFHIGHDAEYKNRPAVFSIFRRIAPHWPGRLIMAGSPLPDSICDEIRRAGLQDRVESMPSPGDLQLEQLYAGASLLLFPSLFEGFGSPPLESIACGCPFVASDVGGLREIFSGEYPGLVSVVDEEQMARVSLDILLSPSLGDQMVSQGRAAIAKLTEQVFAKQLVDSYLRVAQSAGCV